MKFFSLIISVFFIYSLQSFACDIHGKTGFAPENNLKIYSFEKATNGMTEEKFLAIIKRVSDVYTSVVESKGATLNMVNDWEDGTVNAYADQSGTTWSVHMFGGLARHPLITDDGFMGVVCHETGHHLGGAPKYGGGNDWASNEGQADYFATLKCMKRVLQNDDNVAIVSKMAIDQEAVTKCTATYKKKEDIALCERVAMAGKSLAMLLGDLGGNSKVSFSTPDKKIVKKTYDAHPEAQCRLDTYFQGTLCSKSILEDVSDTDAKVGTCVKSDGSKLGLRPLCWYKPGKGE